MRTVKKFYKAGHSCETALLRVYTDIVTTIGRCNGAMLVLLDLSTAFDTIDHDNLFCILENYVGIRRNALKLIKSYFSNRTQRVQIDDVLSDFANIICGVPHGWVLGPLKFCLCCCCLPTPMTLASGVVRCSRLWSTSQLLRPSGQQCSHSGGVCPQIQVRQCGAYVGAVEEMMCVVCVDVTEGA